MSMETVDDMQRDFADVDINNGDSNNEDEDQDEEEEVPSPAVVTNINNNNNNAINQTSIHVSTYLQKKKIILYTSVCM